ncbi:MAG: fibronectin type III domain-containing protein [Pyrinomonadaceae bacterium]
MPQRTDALTGIQRGNQVILIWPALARNAGEGSVQSIRRVDVYRVAEKPTAPLPLTEDQFSARAILIGSVPYDEIRKSGTNLTYTDTLELAGEPARLRYAIRYVNSAGQRAAFSNFFLMEPAARVAEPPTLTSAGNEYSETAITLKWVAPATNIDGSTPVNLLGYNVYRIIAGQPQSEPKPLNQEPVIGTEYQDKRFKFGEKYIYFVRAVSLGTEGRPVESRDSNALPLSQLDTYKPAAPEALQAQGAPGRPARISLFWAANSEPDLAGYIVYRSTDPTLPPDKWTKLTPPAYTKTTFTDENVETGKTYYYYVKAVDNAGNISEASQMVSEAAP